MFLKNNIIELPHKGDGEIIAIMIKKHLENNNKDNNIQKSQINKEKNNG